MRAAVWALVGLIAALWAIGVTAMLAHWLSGLSEAAREVYRARRALKAAQERARHEGAGHA